MKRMIHSIALAMLFLLLPLKAEAARLLIPAGELVGLQLENDTVTVVAFDETFGVRAQEAGLEIGDRILAIDDHAVSNARDVRSILEDAPGSVTLKILRSGKTHRLPLVPCRTEEGKKLGVYLRQGVTGIGTVTWYDPDTGRFGTLGHGVSTRKGSLVPMTGGTVFPARIQRVVPGKKGEPGQLRGTALGDIPLGELSRNTPQGVFGKSRRGWLGEPLPVAAFDQIHPGRATIRSTVTEEGPEEYSVEILKIYPLHSGRNFLLRITDSALLTRTGGIVQGMSGSPILQDGRLVGAVTHVMVGDPTTGYGIFIGNMLDAAA